MQLSTHAVGVQLHVLYYYDNINNTKTKHFQIDSFVTCQLWNQLNCYYIFTIANLLVYFILRCFSVYLSDSQPNFGYKV
jgi:hypothetical protein